MSLQVILPVIKETVFDWRAGWRMILALLLVEAGLLLFIIHHVSCAYLELSVILITSYETAVIVFLSCVEVFNMKALPVFLLPLTTFFLKNKNKKWESIMPNTRH